MNTIGDRVKRFRLLANLTQYELGDRCGIDGRTIGRIENNRVQPQTRTINLISDALNIPVIWLYADNNINDLDCLFIMKEIKNKKYTRKRFVQEMNASKNKYGLFDSVTKNLEKQVNEIDSDLERIERDPEGYISGQQQTKEDVERLLEQAFPSYPKIDSSIMTSMLNGLNDEGKGIVKDIIEVLLKHECLTNSNEDQD